MSRQKISIITIVLNNAKAFEKTASSIQDQDYSCLEWIVIDGGSFESTINAIIKFEKRISYWISEPDLGPYDAMNKGVAKSAGDWVIFMNAGDTFVEPNTISRVFSHDLNGYGAVYGDVLANYSGIKKLIKAGPVKDLWKGMIFCHQAVFTKRHLIASMGFDIKYTFGADYQMLLRIRSGGQQFLQLPIPIAVIDISGISNRSMVQSAKDHFAIALIYFQLNRTKRWYHLTFISWVRLVEFGYRYLPVGLMHKFSLFYRNIIQNFHDY